MSKTSNKMDLEIQVAVQFVVSFFSGKYSEEKLTEFAVILKKLITDKFEGHWYPDKPAKGSAYRCISVENQLDALLITAAELSKLSTTAVSSRLPKKLDLWVDPTEVSYRIGEYGPVTVIYKEGDDCVNSTSKHLANVLKQLPTVTQKNVPSNGSNTTKQFPSRAPVTSHETPLIPQVNIPTIASNRRMDKFLSPSAKSFVSRNNQLNIPFLNNRSLPQAINPLLNLEYLQKLQQWPLLAAGGYDPLAAQLVQNYLIMQELQRFETRRLALQSHYLKMQNMRWPKKYQNHHSPRPAGSTSTNPTNGKSVQISV